MSLPIPDDVRFDERGLVAAILQDADTGEVLTLAYMNEESLRRSCESERTWLWSRSREELWEKGATSGNVQAVVSIVPDCDRDALLVRVRPDGPACHRNTRSCFDGSPPTLAALQDRLARRAAERPENSYTVRLLEDENHRLKKLGEEAVELALACTGGDEDEVRDEAADLLYHLMVALLARGLSVHDAVRRLGERMGARVGE